ncbi:MAG: hypothetical protein ACRDRO_21880 [Pseudonocardiaceae bacterium]
MTTTTVDLLDSLRAHLTEFELPALWSVHLTASSGGPNVSGQLPCHHPPEIASALLAWADTLTEITAEAWREPSGDTVHLSVIGRLPGGAFIRVYGCLVVTERGMGADLAPNTSTSVPLAVLRERATVEEVTF